MKKLHSLIATLLALSIILSMFTTSFVTTSAVTTDVWTGKIATEFAGGTGTSADPYLIENGAQLAKAIIDKGLKDGAMAYYIITNDIYLNDDYANYKNWATTAPENNWGVTYSSSAFSGSLNGGYHTIYGMYYNRGGSYAGLVTYLSGAGSITNLIISNSYINNTSSNSTALFSGRIDNGTISNCIARDSYITNKDNKTMAGIAAWSNTSTTKITNCAAYGLTFTSKNTVGGILAQSNNGNAKVANCFSIGVSPFGNTGNIDANNSWTWRTYTDVSQDKAGVVKLESSEMQGSEALTNMPKLSTDVWKTTDSYPALKGNGTKGEVWSGAKAAWFAGGKGTTAHPFLIETAEQLYKAIADKGMYAGVAAHYLITADIYLNSNYENYADWANADNAPANNWGTVYSANSFAGYLDGGYHTIYGMYYNASGSYAGLVPYLSGNSATVCNLTVTNSYVKNSGGDSSAVIAGRMDNGRIENCIAHDSYITNSSNTVMAGIVGYTGNGSVNSNLKNCGAYNLTFSANATSVGGMLGKGTWPTYLNGCYSGGTYILGKTDGTSCANSHTDVAGASKSNLTNWSATPEKMKGESAVTNMALSTTIFKATDGYPVLALNNGTEGETWTGAKANGFIGGTGTEEDPYLIATAEQLYKAIDDLGKNSSGTALYYLVVADIYINDNYENYADWGTTAPANNWLPTNGDFIGHLDGGLNTVYGLYSSTSAWRNGLIRRINSGATVSNVIVSKAYVHNNDAVAGGIVGAMYDNTKIERCMVYDAVISAAKTEVAGIAGKACKNTTTISNCATYNLTLSATSIKGGILGKADQGTSGANGTRVYNCYSVGNYPLGNNNNIWSDYNYSDIQGSKGGIALVDNAAMKGDSAITSMKYLDFINTWKAVENSYPVLREAAYDNLNQEIEASYSIERGDNKWVVFSSKIDMPKINPTYDDNIVISVDGVDKTVKEVGVVISRKGFETDDIATVENTPLTGYKVVGYTNGADNSKLVTVGGQIELTAIVNGNVEYTAKSYIVFADDSVVLGDLYDVEPSTETVEVTSGIEVSDIFESGDANFDGEIDLKDVVRFKKRAAEAEVKTSLFDVLDMDNNGTFDATDISKLRIELLTRVVVPSVSNMQLVFEDDFNTLNLDNNKWDFTNYMEGYGVTTSTDSDVQSIKSENGDTFLRLTSYKTDAGEYKATKSISTGNKLTFVHGYLEIRAKVPTVKGAWPSLWLKSNTGNANLGWDSSLTYNTEVDVFEVMGGNKAISELHKWQKDPLADIRYGAKFERNAYEITDNNWHTYGMLWTEDGIIISVDGVEIQKYNLNKDFEVKWPWDDGIGMENFKTEPLCITLNNHLFTPEYANSDAGSWAKNYVLGDDFTESVYDIDYVRLYQDSPVEGETYFKAN